MTRIALLFFKLYSVTPVRNFMNREAGQQQERNPLPLDSTQERIVRDLKENGIAVAHIDELFPGRQLFPDLCRYTQERVADAETKTAKTFLRQLWDAVPIFNADDPFIHLAMEERVLAVVNAYLALYAKLYYFTLNVTTPVKEGEAPIQSQKWHRDPEDRNMCKVFLYLNDVDETAGPFVYAKGSQYGGKFGHLFPQDPPRGSHPSHEEIMRAIPKESIITATGKAGTIIFCDTAGIHRGGYATQNMRLMFTAGYRSPSSPWPVRYKLTDEARGEIEHMKLSTPVRYALDSNPPTLPLYFLKKIKKNFSDYA